MYHGDLEMQVLNSRMNKFDFNYLLKRSALINEMAKTSSTRPEQNEKVANFINVIRPEIGKKLFEKWKVPGNIKLLNDYVTEALYEKIFNATFQYTSVNQYIAKLWEKSPELKEDYLDFIGSGSNDSNKRSKWIISYLANRKPNLATSEQFFNEVTSPEYIEEYKQKLENRLEFKSRAKGYATSIQKKYSMSANDFATMKGEVWPIITKLNRRSKTLLPLGTIQSLRNKERIVLDTANKTTSEDLKPLEVFIETLIGLRDDGDLVEYYNVDIKGLSAIIQTLEDRLSNNKPVSKEKLYDAFINKFPPKIKEYVADEYETDLEAFSTKGFSEELIDDKRKAVEDILDIYTPDFLKSVAAKGIITEPEIEMVLKWKELIKTSNSLEKQEISAGRKAAGFSSDEIDTSDDLSDVGKAADKRFYEKEKESPTQKPKKPRKRKDDEEEEEEEDEGVMGYMTEQIKSDRLSNTIGEFKDRGFKKPVNYNHWLQINS
jgi:hypothetical protein